MSGRLVAAVAATVAAACAPLGAHFFPEAPPLPAFGFTTACAGYMTPALCVADPGCGWCDGGVDKHDSPEGYGACVECDSGGGACSGEPDQASFAHSSAAVAPAGRLARANGG